MLDAIIIGAGFSGLYQLHSLKNKLGLKCHLFEMGEEVGGTWYWNGYPGARCDTESQAYCYYFDKWNLCYFPEKDLYLLFSKMVSIFFNFLVCHSYFFIFFVL